MARRCRVGDRRRAHRIGIRRRRTVLVRFGLLRHRRGGRRTGAQLTTDHEPIAPTPHSSAPRRCRRYSTSAEQLSGPPELVPSATTVPATTIWQVTDPLTTIASSDAVPLSVNALTDQGERTVAAVMMPLLVR